MSESRGTGDSWYMPAASTEDLSWHNIRHEKLVLNNLFPDQDPLDVSRQQSTETCLDVYPYQEIQLLRKCSLETLPALNMSSFPR